MESAASAEFGECIDVAPAAGHIGALDRGWPQKWPVVDVPVVLDLTDCRFIELASLIYLSSRIAQHARRGGAISLRLPRERKVRDFFRDWDFPHTLFDSSGLRFQEIVASNDRHYFGERRREIAKTDAWSWYADQSFPSHMFPIQTFFSRSTEYGRHLAAMQSERWQGPYVLAVLDRYLNGHGKRVATHIVFEAIMNAVRHPQATLIQFASHYTPPGRSGVGHLTLVVWDDGKGIVPTLRAATLAGDLRTSPDAMLHRQFETRILRFDGTKSNETVSSKDAPTTTTPNPLLLLSALFPGVTSLPGRQYGDAHPDVGQDQPALKEPGMGLFVLLNTAVDVFGGEVAVRTSDLFMNIKRTDGTATTDNLPPLQAKIAESSPNSNFMGNMLTIRLPITATH